MYKYLIVLFKKHKKHIPVTLEGNVFGELLKYGISIFASAWLLQGMLYMNWRETIVKLVIDIIITIVLIIAGVPLAISFIMAHTLNFTFNGQFFAMFTHMGATNVSPQRFLDETKLLKTLVEKKEFVSAAIAYGSPARGVYKSTSDLDLRLIPSEGEINWWKAAVWVVGVRAKSFIRQYPLDLYVFGMKEVTRKMRSDEMPIIFSEKDNYMAEAYPDRISFDEFVRHFTGENL